MLSITLWIFLSAGGLLGQPVPTDLTLPVNNSSTGVRHLFQNVGAAFFDSKDEPTLLNGFEAYRYFVTAQTSGFGEATAMQNNVTPFHVPNYPNLVLGGGYLDDTGENAHNLRVVDHYFGTIYNGGIFGYGVWGWFPTPLTAAFVTAGITGRDIGVDETSRYSVVGYDFTHGGVPDHYVAFRTLVEVEPEVWIEAYLPISRGTMPNGLAVYDIGFREEAVPNQLHDLIVATTEDVNVEPPVPPLIDGYVVTEALYWTGQMSEPNPLWTRVDLGPDEIRNMQLSLRSHQLRAVALNGTTNEFVAYRGVFNFHELVLWEPIPITTNVPVGSIPYDLEILELSPGVLVMMAATSNGVYISIDDGANWSNAGNSLGEMIHTPELRKISVSATDNHDVAVAGWYGSYLGHADELWNFTWNEVSFDPILYQHFGRAWSALRAASPHSESDIVLVNYGTSDPNDPMPFRDPKPVVIQVQPVAPATTSTLETIYLGSQDEGTRPHMRFHGGQGNPWIVYNSEGEGGPVVRTGIAPDFLEWNSIPLFDDVNDTPVPVSDISTSPMGDFIMFDNREVQNGHVNQLWRNTIPGPGWEAAQCGGIEGDMLTGYVAGGESQLFALFPVAGNSFLYKSSDFGDNFALISDLPQNWSSATYNTISTGFDDDMPLYVGGRVTQTGDGILYQRTPGNPILWASMTLSANNFGPVQEVVADPYEPLISWISTRRSDGVPQLSYVVLSSMPPNAVVSWWKPRDQHADEYDIRDIQLLATSETHRVLDLTLKTPNVNDQEVDHTVIKRWEFDVPATGTLPAVVDGTWLLNGTVTIEATETVTINAGAELLCAPGAKLVVKGTLNAAAATFKKMSPDQSVPWSGIEVQGIAGLATCTISGATIGLSMIKAGAVALSNCEIFDNTMGVYVYDNPTGMPQGIESCNIHNNSQQGISLLASKKLTLAGNQIHDNGLSGILVTNGQATLNENSIHHNGKYGLECVGSSPVLYCNTFENNSSGEMALFNRSYPVLWGTGAGDGGVNSFLNDHQTLISMWDSYPVILNGKNNFTVGSTGYFLADMSSKPPKHDISLNYWNPTLSLSKLYPSNPTFWTWSSTTPHNDCGSPKGTSGGEATVLYEQGFTSEMSGDLLAAQTTYNQLMGTYPDSALAMAAAARTFDIERTLDTTFTDLQTTFLTLANQHPEDTSFVQTVQALATRLWVEGQQYDPAYVTYEQIMYDPPTEVDSAFAALDYAITALRQGYDSTHSGLDAAGPSMDLAGVMERLSTLNGVVPPVPQAHHEGYVVAPDQFALEQNFPNPFNATTTLRYYLPQAAHIKLDIFNIAGQKVASLVDANQESGMHNVPWNGESMASGMYIYRLDAGGHILTHKMLLLK